MPTIGSGLPSAPTAHGRKNASNLRRAVLVYPVMTWKTHHSAGRPPARGLAAACLALLLVGAGSVFAGRVTLKITVANPLDAPQTKDVRANLPPGVEPDDVLEADGLEVRYDVEQDLHYVFRSVELAPKSRADFRVTLRDVWTIPDETLARLRAQATALGALLADTDYADTAAALRDGILETMDTVETEQRTHALSAGARAVDHVRARQVNDVRLRDVRHRLARLENLALASGRDPGALLGEDPRAPAPDRTADGEPAGEALFRVTVRNPSPVHARRLDVRHPLPSEIRPGDVLDADGLATASEGGIVHLALDGLELAPGEARTFNVRIRDRWNVNRPRLVRLQAKATDLRERVAGLGAFDSVLALLDEARAELEAIEQASAPDTLNERYVAFFRAERERLDAVERRLHRVEAALRPVQPSPRLGFEATPPDVKTTWRIIWIILGFLGTISLLFFVRWYGRSKAEKLDERD